MLRCGGSIYQQRNSPDETRFQFKVLPGKLKTTRSIGDYELKSERHGYKCGVIIGEPEIDEYELADGDFILMASLYCSVIFR